jgi:hypothetical protein
MILGDPVEIRTGHLLFTSPKRFASAFILDYEAVHVILLAPVRIRCDVIFASNKSTEYPND